MHIPKLSGAWLPRQRGDDGANGTLWLIPRRFRREPGQRALHGGDIVEGVHAVGARAEFTGRLRAPEEQLAYDGRFITTEIQDGARLVLELSNPCVSVYRRKSLLFEGVQGLTNLVLRKFHYWIAARFLITAGHQCIEGERVVLRGDDLLFYQRAKHAGLYGVEDHTLTVPQQRQHHTVDRRESPK